MKKELKEQLKNLKSADEVNEVLDILYNSYRYIHPMTTPILSGINSYMIIDVDENQQLIKYALDWEFSKGYEDKVTIQHDDTEDWAKKLNFGYYISMYHNKQGNNKEVFAGYRNGYPMYRHSRLGSIRRKIKLIRWLSKI